MRMKKSLLVMCCLLSMTVAAQENAEVAVSNRYTTVVPDNTKVFESKRPPMAERLFVSDAVEAKISEVQQLLSGNPRLAWMFALNPFME